MLPPSTSKINIQPSGEFGQMEFDFAAKPAIVDPIPAVVASMNCAARRSNLSRPQICDRMTSIMADLGIGGMGRAKGVTVPQLDKWLSTSVNYTIPLRLLPVFCAAVNDYSPLSALVSSVTGLHLVSDSDYRTLTWAKAELELKRARARAKRLADAVAEEGKL